MNITQLLTPYNLLRKNHLIQHQLGLSGYNFCGQPKMCVLTTHFVSRRHYLYECQGSFYGNIVPISKTIEFIKKIQQNTLK